MVGKGKGKARVERCRNVSGESSDDKVAPTENYESEGELVGEAIGRSPSFPPNLAAVFSASKTIEERRYREAFIKVGKIKYPEQVEVRPHVAFCLGRVFLIRCFDKPRACSPGESWKKACVA